MFRTRFVIIALTGVAVLAGGLVAAQRAGAATICTPVVFVGVRGSGQPVGFGTTVQSVLDSYKTNTTKTTGIYALVYPAAGVPLVSSNADVVAFFRSVNTGSANLVNYLTTQERRCPTQKLVLAGYSQGAAVIDDALPSLRTSITNRIAGVALIGDPQFSASFNGNVGTYSKKHDGILRTIVPFDAPDPYVPSSLANRTQSYCLLNDPVCDYSVRATTVCLWGSQPCIHGNYIAASYAKRAGTYLASSVR